MENGRSVILTLVVLATVIALSVVTLPKNAEVATPTSAVATETFHPGGWLLPAIVGGLIIVLWVCYKLINRRL